jgi:hypothetical protein
VKTGGGGALRVGGDKSAANAPFANSANAPAEAKRHLHM